MRMSVIGFLLSVLPVQATLLSSIIISRHGVRTPYGPNGDDLNPQAFRPFSNLTFPLGKDAWGVDGVAMLTPHGAEAVHRMGQWYGTNARYSQFVPSPSNTARCEDLVFFADDLERDVETAHQFLLGMAPHCASSISISTQDAERLFNQGQYVTDQCRLSSLPHSESLAGGGNATALLDYYMPLLDRINSVIGCCNISLCDNKYPCRIPDLPLHWIHLHWAALGGPLQVAGYFAEFFLLEYLNNMSFAFDQMTSREIIDSDRLQVNLYELVDTRYAARSFASMMVAYIIGTIRQTVTGASLPGMMHGPSAKLVYLAGHDTNLVLLRYLLGFDWIVDGWTQNTPPPGGMLVIELHEDAGAKVIRLFFEVARPEQIRGLSTFTPRSPPSRTRIAIPGCETDTSIDCPVDQFLQILATSVNLNCVHSEGLLKIVQSLLPDDEPKQHNHWKWAFVGVTAGLGTAFLVLLAAYIRRHRRRALLPDLRSRQLLEEAA
eukprot:c21482_g1_i1.p1 GENE.c21482_g1_i1~~c21482_g1_i1.p1  ORF type:complete len:502 (+),score=80.70 c21482_g1_i1:35-1507(+)